MALNPPTRGQTSIQTRLWEWLWRRRAIEDARARLGASEAHRNARERAQVALELAERAREPSEPFAPEPDPARASQLYREAVHWALLASSGESARERTFSELWPAANAALSLRAAGEEGRSERFRMLLEQPAASHGAGQSGAGQDAPAPPAGAPSAAEHSRRAAEAAELAAGARVLVAAANADDTALQRLRRERRLRVGLFLVLLAFGVFRGFLALRDGIDLREDLAQGKPWRLSSESLRCDPVERRCGNYIGMTIFFHTGQDPSPWFELDLQKEQRVTEVRVRNRTDCCGTLAVPLVVELSQDGQVWREVARRSRNFRNWRAKFAATNARWVRLRVDRFSTLHLERVSVYR